MDILREALQNQILQLQEVLAGSSFKQASEVRLLDDLKRQLAAIKK